MQSLERKRKNPKSSTDVTTFTFPLLGRRRASFSRLTHTPPPMGSASWRKPPPRRSSRAPTSPPAAFGARPSGASGVPFSPREKESGRGEQSPQLLQTSSPDLPTPGGEILQPVSGWPPGQTLGRGASRRRERREDWFRRLTGGSRNLGAF